MPKPKGRRGLLKLIVGVAAAGAIVMAGSYGAWAAGLAQSNYRWFTDSPDAQVYTLKTPGDVYSFAEIVNGTAPDAVKNTISSLTGGQIAYDFFGKTVQIATGADPEISDIPTSDPTGKAGELPLNALGTHYEFEPIGTDQYPFQGTFNGNGATLRNMIIDNDAPVVKNASDAYPGITNLGLFGVIGDQGSAKNFTVTGDINLNTEKPLTNIGGAVGKSQGTLSDIASRVNLNLTCDAPAYEDDFGPDASMKNIGGVVGRAYKSISGLTYAGSLEMTSKTDALANDEGQPEAVAKGIGCVAGSLGGYDRTGKDQYTHVSGMTATACTNSGSMYLSFTGTSKDDWGTAINAKPSGIGGIVGISTGSIYDCANTGTLRTSTREGSNNPLNDVTNDNGGSGVGGIVGNLRNTGIKRTGTGTDGGSASDRLVVSRCSNTALITGSNSMGGIVGSAGTYTLITECSNGNALAANANIQEDKDTLDSLVGAIICTQWNNPSCAGIAGSTRGSVSYCDNRGVVNNTQAGYYLAGIVSHLGYDSTIRTLEPLKDDKAYKAEVFGCYNTGQVAPGHSNRNRYGALVGNNFGYVHDCVLRYGCVTIGKETNGDDKGASYPIGGDVQREVERITTLTVDELKTATPTATLNANCFTDGNYGFYWFSGLKAGNPDTNGNSNYNDGFPALTTWAKPQNGIPLDAARMSGWLVEDALYTNGDMEPVPTVSLYFMQDDGKWISLTQNSDFLILPEEGAFERTDDKENKRPYRYSVRGIGNYSGEVLDFGSYGIMPGTFGQMTVVVDDTKKFNWHVQFPESVKVVDRANQEMDPSNYSWVIYDSGTNNTYSAAAPKCPVFDSQGFIEFNDNGQMIPALEAVSRVNDPTAFTSFVVYDANRQKISDSEGYVYDEYGNMVSGTTCSRSGVDWTGSSVTRTSLIGYSSVAHKNEVTTETWDHNGEEGYVVEVFGQGDYEGTNKEGRFVIATASLDADCDVSFTTAEGITYYNDNEIEGYYRLIDETRGDVPGNRYIETYTTSFTAEPILPECQVSYQGVSLRRLEEFVVGELHPASYETKPYDHGCDYGGPEVNHVMGTATPAWLINRNATIGNDKYGAALTPTASGTYSINGDRNYHVSAFSGFVDLSFDITQADASSVKIECMETIALPISTTDGVRDGISCPVSASLQKDSEQISLREGVDFEVSYYDESGTTLDSVPNEFGAYTAKVTLLPLNFVGDLEVGEFAFDVTEGKAFTVVAEQKGSGDYAGLYIEDTQWSPGQLYPAIQLCEPNDTSKLIDAEFDKDYTYKIGDFSSWDKEPYTLWNQVQNASKKGDNTLYPYVNGSDLSIWSSNVRSYGRPLKVTVVGLGEYEGCETSVLWQITPWDLSTTKDELWDIHLEDPSYCVSTTWGIVEYNPNGYIYYDDNLVYFKVEGNGNSYKLFSIKSEPYEPVNAGDLVSWVFYRNTERLVTGYVDMVGVTGKQEVLPRNINGQSHTFKVDKDAVLTYDGTAKQPAVTEQSKRLDPSKDFSLTYKNNIDVGVATAVVEAHGNFTGTREVAFSISPRDFWDDSVRKEIKVASIPDQRFTGVAIIPEIEVTDTGLADGHVADREKLVKGKDYEVYCYGNTDIGTATIEIIGTGNYEGYIAEHFNIVPDPEHVSYYVDCVDVLNPARHLKSPVRVDGFEGGQEVTVDAPEIENYVPMEESQTLTLDAYKKNSVTFYYLHKDAHLPEDAEEIGVSIFRYKDNARWYALAQASILPSNADQSVKWSTSDLSVAGITEKGYIAAYSDGVVDISATSVYSPDKTGSERLAVVGKDEETPFTTETDGVTGAIMSNVPSGSKLVVSRNRAPGVELGGDEELLDAFDVGLYALEYELDEESGKYNATDRADMTLEVQPVKDVEICLPIPEGTDLGKLAIYHWDAEHSSYETEDFEVTSDGRHVVFTTDHLSLFTLVNDKSAAPVNPPTTEVPGTDNPGSNPSGNGNGGGVTLPGTGNQGNDSNGGNGVWGNYDGINNQGGGLSNNSGNGGSGGNSTGTPLSSEPTASGASGSADGAGSQGDDPDSALSDPDMPTADASANDLSTLADTGEPLSSSGEPTAAGSAFQIDWGKVLAAVLLLVAAAGGVGYIIYRTRKDNEGL